MQDLRTALIALNVSLNHENLYRFFNNLKIQISNRSTINTKESLLLELENTKPNFLFISSALPGVIELSEVLVKAKKLLPNTKVTIIINENDKPKILNYLTSGADALIWGENFLESTELAMKQLKKEQLFLCGKTTLELRTILQTHKVETLSNKDLLELLTARETEVLHSLTQGVNYKQIAKLLFISESTVKTHVNNIFTKLNVSDRTQAVLYALRHGIESLAKKPNILRDITNEALHKNQLSV